MYTQCTGVHIINEIKVSARKSLIGIQTRILLEKCSSHELHELFRLDPNFLDVAVVVVGLDVKTSLFRVSSDCDPVQDLTFGPTSAILNSAEMLQDHLPADVSMQTVQTVQSEPVIQSAKWPNRVQNGRLGKVS